MGVVAVECEAELSVVDSLEFPSAGSGIEEIEEEEASAFDSQQADEQHGKVGSGGFALDVLSTFSDSLLLSTGTVWLDEGRTVATFEDAAEEGVPAGGTNAPGKRASTAAGTYSCSIGRTPQSLQRKDHERRARRRRSESG